MSEETQVESVGSVNPSPDANDDALLDNLGFNGDPSRPEPVKNDSSMPDSVEPRPSYREPKPEVKESADKEILVPDSKENDFDFPADLTPASTFSKPTKPISPEVKPQEEPAETEVKFNDPKANHAFAELRHRNGELQKELAELKQQLEQTREQGPAVEEIKSKYEEQIKVLEEQVGQYDLASTPAFKQKYDAVLQGMLSRVAGLLKKAGASDAEALRIANELRSKKTVDRANELNDFAPALAGPIVNIFEDFDELLFKREADLRNWRESKKAVEEEERRIGHSKTLQIADTLAVSTLNQLSSERNPFYTTSQSDPSWNRKVSDRINTYKGLLKSGKPEVLAKLVAEGLTADEFKKMYFAERERRLSYEKMLEERQSFSGAPSNRPSSEVRSAPRIQAKNDDELLTSLGF